MLGAQCDAIKTGLHEFHENGLTKISGKPVNKTFIKTGKQKLHGIRLKRIPIYITFVLSARCKVLFVNSDGNTLTTSIYSFTGSVNNMNTRLS